MRLVATLMPDGQADAVAHAPGTVPAALIIIFSQGMVILTSPVTCAGHDIPLHSEK